MPGVRKAQVGNAVQEILRHEEIRAIVMVSTYRPAAQFIRSLKDQRPDLLFANVFVGSDALAEELLQLGWGTTWETITPVASNPGSGVTQSVVHLS